MLHNSEEMATQSEEPPRRISHQRTRHISLSRIFNSVPNTDDQENSTSKKHRIKHQRCASVGDENVSTIRLSLKEMCETLKKPTIETEQVILTVVDPTMTTVDPSFLRNCITCATDVSVDQFIGLFSDACLHIERMLCNKCLYEHTKCIVEDWNLFEETIPCPETACTGRFEYIGIRKILLELGQNSGAFEQYEMRLMQKSLEGMPEFVWCAHGCGSGQLHGFDPNEQPVVECVKCKQKTCFKHRMQWHTDLTCDEYDIQNGTLTGDEATDRWLGHFTKICPQCGYHIQKNDGCDHMTCRFCKHEFCWECLVNYHEIANHGASQHLDTCSHYEPVSRPTPSNDENIPTTAQRLRRRDRHRCEVQ